MRRLPCCGFLVLTLLMGQLSLAVASQFKDDTGTHEVIKRAGEFYSPNGRCLATLKVGKMGGMLVLSLGKDAGRQIKDVTGMAWISDGILVYTTSPIYGIPGVYVYSCDSRRSKRIVAPRTINNAYPDGADYFRLKRISQTTPSTVYFYYVPDVDLPDVKNLESPAYLFQVHLDGTGLKKTG